MIALAGAHGRLGREIATTIKRDPAQYQLGLELVRDPDGSKSLGEAKPDFDVLIDVSTPDAAMVHVLDAVRLGKPVVIGVTGFSEAQNTQIKAASLSIPVLLSGNFSVGITALLTQVSDTAKALGSSWAATISETHHTGKKDHPSGTALMLTRAIQDGFGHDCPIKTSLYPQKPAPASTDYLSIHCTRDAGVVGQHQVVFSCETEQVVLGHTAHSRAIFAEGALRAARWIIGQKSGLYDMKNVLGG
jgi:4-hydroxy-tetrahydrodipicolinate reductase